MGIRFRKSINLGGGFHINLSKSGIGYSWGVKGFRYTKTASGRTRKTYSIPGTGISYVSESKNKTQSQKHNVQPASYPTNVNNLSEIASASINHFQPAEYSDFIHKISNILLADKISTILLFLILFSGIQMSFLYIGALGLILKIFIRFANRVHVEYEMDEFYTAKYIERINAWKKLNESKMLWQVLSAGNVTNRKYEAGASRSINRKTIKLRTKNPFFLKSDVDIITFKLNKETLILLPDKLLIIRGTKVGAEDYDKLSITTSSINFIERQFVPKDAHVLYYTWQYVNKNGGPDKRFKNNRQLPVCQYGVIYLRSESGINVELHCSNYHIAENLKLKLNQ